MTLAGKASPKRLATLSPTYPPASPSAEMSPSFLPPPPALPPSRINTASYSVSPNNIAIPPHPSAAAPFLPSPVPRSPTRTDLQWKWGSIFEKCFLLCSSYPLPLPLAPSPHLIRSPFGSAIFR